MQHCQQKPLCLLLQWPVQPLSNKGCRPVPAGEGGEGAPAHRECEGGASCCKHAQILADQARGHLAGCCPPRHLCRVYVWAAAGLGPDNATSPSGSRSHSCGGQPRPSSRSDISFQQRNTGLTQHIHVTDSQVHAQYCRNACLSTFSRCTVTNSGQSIPICCWSDLCHTKRCAVQTDN